MMPWGTYEYKEKIHVMPTDEDHYFEGCNCCPEDDGEVVIHNSFDGREDFEIKKRLPS